jgi:hypothetical protein
MLFDALTMSLLMVHLIWRCLSKTPASRKSYLFPKYLPSLTAVQQLLASVSVTFAPGLFEALNSATPPTLAYLKSLPHNATQSWAVYLLVLEKTGSRPLVYVGSATNAQSGAGKRFSDYRRSHHIPVYVKAALDDGYTITSYGLLVTMPRPGKFLYAPLRALFLGMEAAFTYSLGTLLPGNPDSPLIFLCLWDIYTLEWAPLNSHSPLAEGVRSATTPDPVAAERRIAYNREYAKVLRLRNKETSRHVCIPCDSRFGTQNDLEEHLKARIHLDKIEGNKKPVTAKLIIQRKSVAKTKAEKKYWCGVCHYAAASKAELTKKHYPSIAHKRLAAAAGIALDDLGALIKPLNATQMEAVRQMRIDAGIDRLDPATAGPSALNTHPIVDSDDDGMASDLSDIVRPTKRRATKTASGGAGNQIERLNAEAMDIVHHPKQAAIKAVDSIPAKRPVPVKAPTKSSASILSYFKPRPAPPPAPLDDDDESDGSDIVRPTKRRATGVDIVNSVAVQPSAPSGSHHNPIQLLSDDSDDDTDDDWDLNTGCIGTYDGACDDHLDDPAITLATILATTLASLSINDASDACDYLQPLLSDSRLDRSFANIVAGQWVLHPLLSLQPLTVVATILTSPLGS